MKKWLFASLIALVIIISVFLVRTNISYSQNSQATATNNSIRQNGTQNNENQISTGKISLQQLSQHNKEGDCWLGYDGKVYDITSGSQGIPSAAAIAPYCETEKEFTQAFISQHGTRKVSLLMKVGLFIGDFEIKGQM